MATRLRSQKPRIPRAELKPGDCLCDHCVGKCCRYFSLPIDEPTTWDDFDAIRWYLAHGQTIVYIDKGTWHLLVLTKCQYLRADNSCAIYLNRPKICREYTTDECEYDDNWIFDKVFERPEQIWEYAEAILPPRRPKKGDRTTHLPVFNIGPAPSSAKGDPRDLKR